ncbi:MAG: CBS domain-containing protein [Christensenellales bacterium]|jgi:predicted transcriptional regulator
MTPSSSTNARRFINAYNQIDSGLRALYNQKRSMSFAELIRNSVNENHVVRKYEDDLIDFGRLRNAIVHKSNDDFIIAEPHIEVVEKIEKIARLITTPPNALTTICKESVLTVEYNVSLANVARLMAEYSYSNIPIYKDGTLIGIANGQKIFERIGKEVKAKKDVDDFMKNTLICEVLVTTSPFKQYEVVAADATVEQVLSLFNHNAKLLAVLITKTGSMNEAPLGIITTTNVMEMNNILDNY